MMMAALNERRAFRISLEGVIEFGGHIFQSGTIQRDHIDSTASFLPYKNISTKATEGGLGAFEDSASIRLPVGSEVGAS
jgi:hypothetical protein